MAMPASASARRFYRAAKQRFDDALLLLEMERTTAAVYLAGYSVECMLKALILFAVPPTQEAEILGRFHGAKAHDYEWLLHLYAEIGGARMPTFLVPHFARVNFWSTDMRYAPGTIAAHEAKAFMDAANQLPRSKLRGIRRKKPCIVAKQASGNRTLQGIEIMIWADRRL